MGMRDGIGQLRDTVGQSAPSDQGMEWHWAISEPSKRGNGTGSNNVNGGGGGRGKKKRHCPSCSEVRKMSIKAEAESLVRGTQRETRCGGQGRGCVCVCGGCQGWGWGGHKRLKSLGFSAITEIFSVSPPPPHFSPDAHCSRVRPHWGLVSDQIRSRCPQSRLNPPACLWLPCPSLVCPQPSHTSPKFPRVQIFFLSFFVIFEQKS